jgi:peptidoglycan/xylan/chitin deacetylase (PgdA/CDA1 family)
MLAAGWELDTQGFAHADLVRRGRAELRHEVAASRRVLQRRYQVPVHWFCYPSGLVEEIEAALREQLPYATVFTHLEPADDPRSFDDATLDRA